MSAGVYWCVLKAQQEGVLVVSRGCVNVVVSEGVLALVPRASLVCLVAVHGCVEGEGRVVPPPPVGLKSMSSRHTNTYRQ